MTDVQPKQNNGLQSLVVFVWPFLILASYIKLFIYYSRFNLIINQFIDFGEILTTFLTDVVFLSILAAFPILMIFKNTDSKLYKQGLIGFSGTAFLLVIVLPLVNSYSNDLLINCIGILIVCTIIGFTVH